MRILVLLLSLWFSASAAYADTIGVFSLDGSGEQCLDGDTLTVTLEDLAVGDVTFDAVLTVVGSSDLNQLGLGVDGGTNPINHEESLTFSLSVENEDGGTIVFEGFAEVDLTFFGASGEQAVFSTDDDLDTSLDNFLTAEGSDDDPVDLTMFDPEAFTLFGYDDGGTVSFRADSIEAQFDVAPVPEPSALALMSVGLAGLVLRRRRAG